MLYLGKLLFFKNINFNFFFNFSDLKSERSRKRGFKKPCDLNDLIGLKRKSYAPESMCKIKYAVDMYFDSRDIRITIDPHPAVIRCDLRNGLGTFTRRQLCDSLCLFATEIL